MKTYTTCPACHRDVQQRGGFIAPHKGGNRKVTCTGTGKPVEATS